ncbi:MAG TPA: PaaI family thioesterase [Myxococcota bacterium]|nr:PaaI family thioesterase [Myxococcota bacterium]
MSAEDELPKEPWKMWEGAKDEPVKWTEKRRLAFAMRLVIERLVTSNAPEEELRRAADGLERYAEQLRNHPKLRYVHGFGESATAGDVGAFFDQSPMIGLANPLAPPIRLSQTGPRSAQGLVTFGSAYEGPPGSVHGGFVAAAFDEVLGYVQSLGERPGMTGTLIVRYRSPTPLHTELRFEAELVGMEGRKIFTKAHVVGDGRVCAEAEGIFISVARERFAELEAKRAEREKDRKGD